MEVSGDEPNVEHAEQSIAPSPGEGSMPDFRRDLAFPKLTEEMVRRLIPYGREETFAAGTILYSYGDRQIDMFVVLDGGIDIVLPAVRTGTKVFARHRMFDFSGEFNLLNSQGAVVEGRTSSESRLLRIPRKELRRLMRAEGDIANLIVQAAIWRRIGIVAEASSGVVLRGRAESAEMISLQRFFVRNIYPHRIIELPAATEQVGIDDSSLPSVTLSDGRILARPTITELADELGITELPDSEMTYDVAVVGAGPAGLAAAVYAASEGLCTLVIEGIAPGGQAGTSSKIENYLGFPTGVSGQQLASRAQLQALKFGVQFAISRETITVDQTDGVHKLMLAGGIPVYARSVVVASGAQYRKLSVSNYRQFENRGTLLRSHGDGVVALPRPGGDCGWWRQLRGSSGRVSVRHCETRPSHGSWPSLASTMSQYLISRIEGSSHITLYTDSEIEKLEGGSSLESVTWINRMTGETTTRPIGSVFVMIGAEPNSGWLFGTVKLDKKGFHPYRRREWV